jgi:hypothetical protein
MIRKSPVVLYSTGREAVPLQISFKNETSDKMLTEHLTNIPGY